MSLSRHHSLWLVVECLAKDTLSSADRAGVLNCEFWAEE